jgi:rhamnosyl/mannosyltransferase
LRIVHVYKDYFPVLGGIENHIRMLAEAQAAAGHDVTVLVTNPGGEPKYSVVNDVKLIRAHRMATMASTPLSVDLPRLLARLRPDITHLQFPYPVGEVSQLLLGKLLMPQRPFVISYQSDVVKQQGILKFYKPVLRRVLANVNHLIVSNGNYIESSQWLRPYADKCTIIPFAVDSQRFSPASQVKRAGAEPVILFVGRHRYYKGVDDLIRAMVKVDARLLIGGDGPETATWQNLVNQLGLRKKITFVGNVPESELPQFYAKGDIFVLPSNSRAESFGLVLQEAMASGLPCVTTELGTGTSWVVRDGESGFVVPPRNSEALAEALQKLVANPELRGKMGQAGRDRAVQEFSLEQMLAKTEAVYEKVRQSLT